MMTNIKTISLVVPCYNEEETLAAFYERVNALSASLDRLVFEFFFVNDGSTDKTAYFLNNLAKNDTRIRVLHLAQNRGHQIAITAGLDFAQGDMVVTIDADLQDPPEIIRDMLARVEEGFDIVHAQRIYRDGESWFKIVTARLFYKLLRIFSDTPILNECGDFRAITRPVLEASIAFRTPYRFLRGMFVRLGFRQATVSYQRNARISGTTKYSFIKMLNLAVDAMLGFSAAPIRIISMLSIVLWLFSFGYIVRALFDHFILHTTVTGWTSIVILLFFFTGLILFCLAIIGAYVGRIFTQGQNQPLYWLADARNLDRSGISKRAETIGEVRLVQNMLDSGKST
jgi:polyisoprenyl-phosphate glycosyltransferase